MTRIVKAIIVSVAASFCAHAAAADDYSSASVLQQAKSSPATSVTFVVKQRTHDASTAMYKKLRQTSSWRIKIVREPVPTTATLMPSSNVARVYFSPQNTNARTKIIEPKTSRSGMVNLFMQ